MVQQMHWLGKTAKWLIIVCIAGVVLVLVAGFPGTMTVTPVHQTTAPESAFSPIAWRWVPSEPGRGDHGLPNPLPSTTHGLDEDAADWGVYCEGSPTWIMQNVVAPSIDGTSLQCSITGGAPYSNVHCYRNLPSEPTAIVFTLALSFWFSPTTTFNNQGIPSVIQALEFTMSKWHQSKRYEFALQWQNVGDGAPQWRYWDPHQSEMWVNLDITDALEGEQWHSFTLKGEIINGQVHYEDFMLDQQSHNLDITLPPATASGEPDRLAVAIQLDGNFEETPYDVFIDQVSFVRRSVTHVHLPLIVK